ncbi:hypothetical protein H4696_008202 [Amycolatopsis lexingtonensis]|uniref:Uncharacterized protein n=1 Tax=Amycolatopsis lexingtonensis TaxID=218822 RepID=A0ABR9ID50_9PSEU|nr:hypothetical protein [Amycolatopsis lexingtonensis]MBE1501102.1 hypothetical protein [Amycolatopsis lexingtonensis]
MSRRVVVLAVLTGAALLMTAPVSGAAQAAGISSADAVAARAAAVSLQDTLVRFFAQAPDSHGPVTVRVAQDAYPVYELSADFVAGKPGAAPGDFAYFAVPAQASDGRTATLWSVRGDDGAWQVGNIASGDVEGAYARQLPAGAQLLHEPQVDAWYAVRDGRLTPLAGGTAVTVADYQRTVGARYADKLPGSAYARDGEAGGYDATSQVMPRGDGGPAAPSHDTGWVPLLILVGVLAVSGAGYVFHLRRHAA